jgi:pimeloyl-ACP methyl ester carboxylesterase
MTPELRSIAVWQDQIHIRVRSRGRGPALVFFHGPWGLTWDPFLDDLARSFTVYAPEHPGTSPGRPDDVYALDGVWDLVLCYDELLEGLGLSRAAFVGHSFGAMVAGEVAAAYPNRVSHLVLIDALGLWRDDAPIPNWMLMHQGELASHVFRDPDGEAAGRMFATGSRPRRCWSGGRTTGSSRWCTPRSSRRGSPEPGSRSWTRRGTRPTWSSPRRSPGSSEGS